LKGAFHAWPVHSQGERPRYPEDRVFRLPELHDNERIPSSDRYGPFIQ